MLCHLISFLSNSYDSEGRLMNVTFPTGMVNNLYADIYSALMVEIESSLAEEAISITTNTSTIRAFYTLVQGKASPRISPTWSSCYLSLFQGSAGQWWVSLSRVSLQLRRPDRRQCKWLRSGRVGWGGRVRETHQTCYLVVSTLYQSHMVQLFTHTVPVLYFHLNNV